MTQYTARQLKAARAICRHRAGAAAHRVEFDHHVRAKQIDRRDETDNPHLCMRARSSKVRDAVRHSAQERRPSVSDQYLVV
eukprot:4433625-Pleurochrysis_carterae.AAC.2